MSQLAQLLQIFQETSLWSQGGWSWCGCRKNSFYFYLTCQLHISHPDSTFVLGKASFTMPQNNKGQKWIGKEPTQLADGLVEIPHRDFQENKIRLWPHAAGVQEASSRGTAQNLLVRRLRDWTHQNRRWEGILCHEWPSKESIHSKSTTNQSVNGNTDKSM